MSIMVDPSLASQPYFSGMCMHMRKWAGGGREKYVWADLPGFRDSVVCAECVHVYIMSSPEKYYFGGCVNS